VHGQSLKLVAATSCRYCPLEQADDG